MLLSAVGLGFLSTPAILPWESQMSETPLRTPSVWSVGSFIREVL